MWTAALVFLLALSSGGCQERKLTSVLNPGCDDCSNGTSVLYTRGDSARDSLHQIWDFSRGRPTAIFAVTDLNASLSLSWRDERPVVFNWTEEPKYSFAAVINQIWEYNDVNDTGVWNVACETRKLNTERLAWTRRDLVQRPDAVRLAVDARPADSHQHALCGSVSINLELRASRHYGASLPHLMHSANSALLEVSLANSSCSRFNSSRVALLLQLVGTDSANESWGSVVRKSLDDEHAPSVFEMVELTSPGSAFVQYRPVAYTTAQREVAASTTVNLGLVNMTADLPSRSTAAVYFRDRKPSELLTQIVIVSYGSTGDGFYTRTNYTVWATTLGYGAPLEDQYSLLVLLVIGVGSAVPVLLLLCGGVCVLARRRGRGTRQRLLD